MNSRQQTEATGYAARIAINVAALVVLAPLKGVELGLRVVEGGLDLASGSCGKAADGVDHAAVQVAKACRCIEAKAKAVCSEVRTWQAETIAGVNGKELSPEATGAFPAAELSALKTEAGALAADAKKVDTDQAAAEEAPKPEAAKPKAKGSSGVKVCDICDMPKTVAKYPAHHVLCATRYEEACALARQLAAPNGNETNEDAALHGAIEAKIRYDGGRPAIVKKIAALLQREAALATAELPKAEAPKATVKLTKEPEKDAGTPGSVIDPTPATA